MHTMIHGDELKMSPGNTTKKQDCCARDILLAHSTAGGRFGYPFNKK